MTVLDTPVTDGDDTVAVPSPSADDELNRREFLRLGGAAAAVGVASLAADGRAQSASPQPFAAPPIDTVRIGMVGVGLQQGGSHVGNSLKIPGCRITAVCDVRPERTEWASRAITAAGHPAPTAYTRGPRDFVRLCETEDLDHRLYIEGRGRPHQWVDWLAARDEFDHPLWRELEQRAAGAGHGGRDDIEDHRLITCLREGRPIDMNVYDAAALSAVVELSVRSNAKRARTVDFPDFTRGRWRTNPPLGIVGV